MSDTERLPGSSFDVGPEAAAPESDEGGVTYELGPGDSVGRYQLGELLGAGGMGRVFAAHDSELGRTVALKVIRSAERVQSGRERSRLLREAQALAKIQHPNVVTIHDVGMHANSVFIAMEAIAGPTLNEWLESKPRSWSEIRDVFVQAGRGLAAVHEAGLVHRDFKPANVLVAGNRAVIVDFGVARRQPDEGAAAPAAPSEALWILDVNLTLTGERVGTPRYMAPEQHTGGSVTAQADQFALAAAMWGALYGAPPFGGRTRSEVLESMEAGPVAPAGHRVPARIRMALTRALSFEPGDRWPTLTALLDELNFDASAHRRRVLVFGAALLAAIAIPVAFVAGGRRQEVCSAPTSTVWDETARAAVRAAFIGTGLTDAAERFDRIDGAIRARVSSWARFHAEACAATEVRHEQPAALMEARMACLGRGMDQISAFIDALRSVDAPSLDRAATEAVAIGDLEACSDSSVLAEVVPSPRDPKILATIGGLEREAARVEALSQAGRPSDAHVAALALVPKATALGYQPLLARVLYDSGSDACHSGDARQAAADLYAASNAAAQAHDDYAATKIYTMLVLCVGGGDASFVSAETLARVAEASLARAGSPPELRGRLFHAEERLHLRAGDLIGAFGYAELVLLGSQQLYGFESIESARALGDLGVALQSLGAFRAAVTAYQRALTILEAAFGEAHPSCITYRTLLGNAEMELGSLDAARRTLEHALALQPTHDEPAARGTMKTLAELDDLAGRFDEAFELAQSTLERDRGSRRPGHPDVSYDLTLLCRIALDRHDLAEATARCDEAFALRVAAFGPDHPDVADVRRLLAEIALERHDLVAARAQAEQALAVHRRCGVRHPRVAADEMTLGEVLLLSGSALEARPYLEEALLIEEQFRDPDAGEVVRAKTLLSEALLATGQRESARAVASEAFAAASSGAFRADLDAAARFALAQTIAAAEPGRALQLAREARDRLRGAPPSSQVAHIDRWLASRQASR